LGFLGGGGGAAPPTQLAFREAPCGAKM
jgi:hypothetical protein